MYEGIGKILLLISRLSLLKAHSSTLIWFSHKDLELRGTMLVDVQGHSVNGGMTKEEWSLLLSRIREKDCTPFLGAAASSPPLPLGREIALKWSDEFSYPLYDRENLPRVARYLALKRDPVFPKDEMRRHLQRTLKQEGFHHFDDCCQIHRVLAQLGLPIYLTTNYDDFMEKALERENRRPFTSDYCRWNSLIEQEDGAIGESFNPTAEHPLVYHLHGTWDLVDSMVLTEDDYIEFLGNVSRSKLHHRIVRAFSRTSLLFIGYSLEDLSFRTIFKSLIDTAGRGMKRTSISVQLDPRSEAENRIGEIIGSIEALAGNSHRKDLAMPRNEIDGIIAQIKEHSKEEGVFALINQLENRLINFLVEDKRSDMIHSVFNRINLLQNGIERLQRAVPTQKFLQEYFKEIDISIYWGSTERFAKELREKCGGEGLISA